MTHLLADFPIRFSGDLPIWVALPLALVAILIVLALYLRETHSIAQPYRWLLPSLRATAIALVVLILSGPVWHHRQVVGTLGRIVFAVDTSQSMSLTDSQSDVSNDNRLARITELLLGDSTNPGWLESMSDTHAVDVVAFSDGETIPIWSSEDGEEIPAVIDWTANGRATDLGSPLRTLLASINLSSSGESVEAESRDVDSVRRAAVVLMTDGRDTARLRTRQATATVAAKSLAGSGTEVNALGVGSVDEPPDVGIVEVIRPDAVAAEGKLAGQIIVKRYGGRNEPVIVRIESGGQTVWQESVQMPNSGQQTLPFEVDVEPIVEAMRAGAPRGVRRQSEILQLTARIESPGADFSAANNVSDFRVSAATRNRRLLIVDSSGRWETRYLKNLFVRDPGWETDVVLFGPGTPQPKLQRGDQPGQFPSSVREISRYDAILLGEVDTLQFTTSDRARIAEFVASGGGLVIIDGRHGRLRSLAQGELADLMPVRYQSTRGTAIPTRIVPNALGLEQPTLGLIDESDRLDAFWRLLPKPTWSAPVELSDGAESWAEVVWSNQQKTPWLATRMYGAGRVFYFASDQTWRWRYKVADRFHARFWNQLVIASMEPPYSVSDQFVALGTDKVEYGRDEPVMIRARLRDTRGNPVSQATVDALVVQNDAVVGTLPLSVENAERGTYVGLAPPMPPGSYSIRIRASGFDESALLASSPIWVVEDENAEMQQMSLDENALRQITSAGDGQYVHESDASQMLDLLKPLSSGTVIESDTVLWHSYLWFWPIILLLTVEWWCRKRAGLV